MRTYTSLLVLLLMSGLLSAQESFLLPSVWLKSENLDTVHHIWTDHYSGLYDAMPENAEARLQAGHLVNFNASVHFDTNQLQLPFNMSRFSQSTVFIVYKPDTNNNKEEEGLWGAQINGQQFVCLTTRRLIGPTGIIRYSKNNLRIAVVNTTTQSWNHVDETVSDTVFHLGGLGDSLFPEMPAFKGDIAELAIFDHSISEEEMQIFESYLSLKYGTTFQYSDYVNSNNETLWSYESFSDYSYSIAGIGRDDSLHLYQKQSTGSDFEGILTVGVGTIATSNEDNPHEIPNHTYLLWGMNDKANSLELSDEATYPYAHPILQRKWLMHGFGSESSQLSTVLQFNIKGLPSESGQYYLAVDRSGTGDFSRTDINYLLPDTIISDSIVVFKNVLWDTDGSGSDIFTLAFGMSHSLEGVHPICHDEATGKVDIRVLGGDAPYSFLLTTAEGTTVKQWQSDSRFQRVDNLSYGRYRLTTTAHHFTISNSFELENPQEFDFALDTVYQLNNDGILQLDGSVHVDTSETVTYTWTQDHQFYSSSPEVSITQPGVYTLTVQNDKGCSATHEITVHTHSASGLLYNYSLYPNPSGGHYTVDIMLSETSPVTIQCYTTEGQLIDTFTGEGSNHYLFRGYIENSGTYILTIKSSLGEESFRLIISRN